MASAERIDGPSVARPVNARFRIATIHAAHRFAS
jgi:hypothetical protein